MKYKLVIFDCDGVLVDSEPLACEAFREVLQVEGIDINLETVISEYTGITTTACIEKIKQNFNVKLPMNFKDIYLNHCNKKLIDNLRPKKNVKQVLINLVNAKSAFCVASNNPGTAIVMRLQTTGIASFFEGRIFSAIDDVSAPKPAPDVFCHAASVMGVSPSQCLVIEDSLTGVNAANNAGMDVIGMLGTTYERKLFEAGAIAVIQDLYEIFPFLNE